MIYAQIIVFKKIGSFDDELTYQLPQKLEVEVGDLVKVPFRNKSQLGLVVDLKKELPKELKVSQLKAIETLVYKNLVNPLHLKLARWMTAYYQTSMARVVQLLVPKRIWSGKTDVLFETSEPLSDFKMKGHVLTEGQKQAVFKISNASQPVLLHGITGSGKTETYLHLIHQTVQAGKQAILLVPEIALTPQTMTYFKEVFGDHMAIFHSKLTEKEKAVQWWKVKSGYAPLIIGSRSAIFAPTERLGLVILDEEHEWTYKQESNPYYQTHHVAQQLTQLFGAKLLLGTATPSVESFFKVQTGEYDYVDLPERINEKELPQISVVDLREEFKKRNFSIFSDLLQNKIRERLEKKEQVILFVNQRGIGSSVVCRDCGQAETCPNCEISLKHHRSGLVCHYCMFQKAISLLCPHCRSPHIKTMGVGTQRVEGEVQKLFPQARVVRADKDTTKNKEGFEPIYREFLNHEYDILIGTQMVAKGLDFKKVSLIGIVLADIGLHIPDFRSSERLFQLITQVAGRCGRGEKEGEVVLQTYNPDHIAIQKAARYEYEPFVEEELKFRKKLGYPPFNRMIKFTVTGADSEKLQQHIQQEEQALEDIFKVNSLSVKILSAPAMVPKIANQYYYHVLIRSKNPHVIFRHWRPPNGWRVDVDPIHTT